MSEPISTAGALGGTKTFVLLAQVAGLLAGLSQSDRMKWWRAGMALLAGFATTFYATPLAMHYFDVPSALESPIGYVLGLASLRFIPPFLGWIERAASDPLAVIFRRETPANPSKD